MPEAADSERVLIFAPIGRDAAVSAEILRRAGMIAEVSLGFTALLTEIQAGAASVFIAEEGLFGQDMSALFAWVERQPAWSDLPFILLTSYQEQPAVVTWRQRLVAALRNVSLLERPVQAITLASSLRSSTRARKRQYQVRALLQDQEAAGRKLEALVSERTRDLEQANGELRTHILERARVEETLRQAQKIEALGRLTGGVAHDFNNLLMVITGGLDMLDRKSDPGRRQRLMDGMRQAAQRGTGLTRQLLAFSRRQSLHPEPIDLRERIGAMRELLDRSLGGDVHVELDFAPDLWPVLVDPGEFELVVLNLAVNARDAMPVGGTILFKAVNAPDLRNGELAGDFIRLSIHDTGTGMSPETQARAFEPFFTTKEIGKGSGLGLPQVYGFAKQSSGAVEIHSVIGAGTEITLILPRSDKEPSPQQSPQAALHHEQLRRGSSGRILLVEDDDEVAALVTELLEQLGYQVLRAASATAALGVLAAGRDVDLVFSDVMMPGGMNGVELAHEIRNRRPDLPVLLTSGYADAAEKRAKAEGVQLLPKPYRLDELAKAIAATIRSSRQSNSGDGPAS